MKYSNQKSTEDRFREIQRRCLEIENLFKIAMKNAKLLCNTETVVVTRYRKYSVTIQRDAEFTQALEYCQRFKSAQGIRNSVSCVNVITEFEQLEYNGHPLGMFMEIPPYVALIALCISDALIFLKATPVNCLLVEEEIFQALRLLVTQEKINQLKTKVKSHDAN